METRIELPIEVQAELVRPVDGGAVVFYDDGRPGHRAVRGVVLDETDRFLVVLWEDRAEANHIRKDDAAWMANIRREEDRP